MTIGSFFSSALSLFPLSPFLFLSLSLSLSFYFASSSLSSLYNLIMFYISLFNLSLFAFGLSAKLMPKALKHYNTFVTPQVFQFIGPSNDGRRHVRGTCTCSFSLLFLFPSIFLAFSLLFLIPSLYSLSLYPFSLFFSLLHVSLIYLSSFLLLISALSICSSRHKLLCFTTAQMAEPEK
jgi:hypothetical protein